MDPEAQRHFFVSSSTTDGKGIKRKLFLLLVISLVIVSNSKLHAFAELSEPVQPDDDDFIQSSPTIICFVESVRRDGERNINDCFERTTAGKLCTAMECVISSKRRLFLPACGECYLFGGGGLIRSNEKIIVAQIVSGDSRWHQRRFRT